MLCVICLGRMPLGVLRNVSGTSLALGKPIVLFLLDMFGDELGDSFGKWLYTGGGHPWVGFANVIGDVRLARQAVLFGRQQRMSLFRAHP